MTMVPVVLTPMARSLRSGMGDQPVRNREARVMSLT
jgi:hypothetical protein